MAIEISVAEYRRMIGGKKAQATGKSAESIVDDSLDVLQAEGRLIWHPTGPRIKWVGPEEIVPISQGPPDRMICFSSGLNCWLEVKSWQNKNTRTERERLHQYETMVRFAGSPTWTGAYVVYWFDEWRLHSWQSLERLNDGHGESGYALVFHRAAGIEIEGNELQVDLWPALKRLAQKAGRRE